MSDFRAFVEELFAGFGPVRLRRMFGVTGLFANDVIFGLIDEDTIYLKADEALKTELVAEGSVAWVYRFAAEPVAIGSYWRLPEAALDDPDAAAAWARKALAVAEAKAAGKKPKPRNPEVARRS
ncbi:TfoX/Sxy family protein [Phenylobacterium sp.]|jgi:DNA transformation protein and related proteins|uniref:TfoX/Sxy family protein n=1 Tax=Phenylobacterium sp. TaxID=1871053 RepID=UPI001216BA2E|nr:TfoX/Sxy family protein [Phenylobacterium sp.]THD55096.1 MAG: TfoX family protein [Phenylobacterium sp.]